MPSSLQDSPVRFGSWLSVVWGRKIRCKHRTPDFLGQAQWNSMGDEFVESQFEISYIVGASVVLLLFIWNSSWFDDCTLTLINEHGRIWV